MFGHLGAFRLLARSDIPGTRWSKLSDLENPQAGKSTGWCIINLCLTFSMRVVGLRFSIVNLSCIKS